MISRKGAKTQRKAAMREKQSKDDFIGWEKRMSAVRLHHFLPPFASFAPLRETLFAVPLKEASDA